ncbi:MAG: N-acetylmuramoyl-L-alanine amidase family protein [Clostridiales bacterium]|nr:N-acetylmuramoyl-L-alanine amidase family protein [Clostridiales bacterium]
MFTGWVKTSTGYRYFNKSTGYMYTGWVKNSSGKYRFFNRSTGYMYTGWMTTSSGKRYFNKSNGIMLTGWNSSKTRYFHASNGIMYTGLKKIGSYYYYFNTSTGVMLTSTSVTVSGVTYTISSSGVCTKTATVTTATSTGTKTIKNYLAGAISPVGQVLYVWGGGWNNSTTIGIPSTMISFYNSQSADYDYTDYMDLSTSTRAKGFDCSGFVGWAAYQVMRSGSGYTVTAENVGSYYKSLGWGSLVSQSKLASTDYKLYAGDVGYNSGHTWIVVGQCSDSSIVIVHSTPNAGVQLSGTPTPSGDYSSEAITLAKKYMSKYSGYTKYSYHTSSGNYIKNGAYFRWSSSTLSDPDGYKSMTASQILANLYS